jgi:hypothetical protein
MPTTCPSVGSSEAVDVCQRWKLRGELNEKAVQGLGFALDFDQDIAGSILDETVQLKARSQAKYEGSEADALHDAFNDN